MKDLEDVKASAAAAVGGNEAEAEDSGEEER